MQKVNKMLNHMGQEKNIHGPEALECKGPELDLAHAGVQKKKRWQNWGTPGIRTHDLLGGGFL